MGPRVLWFTDWHLHPWRVFSDPDPEYGLSRVRNICESGYWVRDLLLKYKPDALIFGGDLVEDRRSIDWLTYNQGFAALRALSEACITLQIPFIAINGNHDIFNEGLKGSALFPVSGLRVDVCVHPKIYRLKGEEFKIIPYLPHHLVQGWDDLQTYTAVTFMHLSVVELIINGKLIGDTPIDSFNSDRVFGGHYHNRSVFTSATGKTVTYTGAIIPRNFCDTETSGYGASLIDIETGAEERFENPHAYHFVNHRIDDLSGLADLDQWLDRCDDRQRFNKVMVRRSLLPMVHEIIHLSSPADWKWKVLPVRDKHEEEEETRAKADLLTDHSILSAFMRTSGREDPDLLRLGLELKNGTFRVEEWLDA